MLRFATCAWLTGCGGICAYNRIVLSTYRCSLFEQQYILLIKRILDFNGRICRFKIQIPKCALGHVTKQTILDWEALFRPQWPLDWPGAFLQIGHPVHFRVPQGPLS